jgi:hypothetical protein
LHIPEAGGGADEGWPIGSAGKVVGRKISEPLSPISSTGVLRFAGVLRLQSVARGFLARRRCYGELSRWHDSRLLIMEFLKSELDYAKHLEVRRAFRPSLRTPFISSVVRFADARHAVPHATSRPGHSFKRRGALFAIRLAACAMRLAAQRRMQSSNRARCRADRHDVPVLRRAEIQLAESFDAPRRLPRVCCGLAEARHSHAGALPCVGTALQQCNRVLRGLSRVLKVAIMPETALRRSYLR